MAAADPEQLTGSGAARPGTRRHRTGHRTAAHESCINEVAATATIDTLLDQLTAEGRLTASARRIVENLAAGDGKRNDPNCGPRAAATERLRVVTRLRSDPRVREALLAR
jgi:hypothetical protein